MKIAIVVPTVRPERLDTWLAAWKAEFQYTPCERYIIQDGPCITHEAVAASWAEIDADLGENADVISRRTDGIRCYGFLLALRAGADIIITLDDDVLPASSMVLQRHVDNLRSTLEQPAWADVGSIRTRGRPFRATARSLPCHVSHGLWHGVPDLDAPSQLCGTADFIGWDTVLPAASYAPLSAMNIAFTRSIASAFYFPPQGAGQPYDRFGDIWAGVIAKRIADHLQYGVHSGRPYVNHQRASDPFQNLLKEAPGTLLNETFWQVIDEAPLRSTTTAGCVRDLADHLSWRQEPYYQDLAGKMLRWLALLPSDVI